MAAIVLHTGNALWHFIFELLGCAVSVVRLRALLLLEHLLSTADGLVILPALFPHSRVRSNFGVLVFIYFVCGANQVDPKLVKSFENVNGFHCMAEKLSLSADDSDPVIIEALLGMLFWRRSRRSFSVTRRAAPASTAEVCVYVFE